MLRVENAPRLAFLCLIAKLYMVVADFRLFGSGCVVAVAALAVAAALVAVVTASTSGSGAAVVVDVYLLPLSLSETDGVDVCVGVVLREGCRER